MIKRANTQKDHIEQLGRAIHLENVTIAYNSDNVILQNSSIEVNSGAMVAVMSPIGSGKSTLLKTILGMIKPVTGYVYVYSRPVDVVEKNIVAIVPLKKEISWNFPITVNELVTLGRYEYLKYKLFVSQTDKDVVADVLKRLDLTNKKNTIISELSENDKQKVIIARAIAQDTRIILLDEPLAISNIDDKKLIIDLLKEENKKGKTIILAHHDVMNIPDMFSQIIVIKDKKLVTARSKSNSASKNIPFISDSISLKDVDLGI